MIPAKTERRLLKFILDEHVEAFHLSFQSEQIDILERITHELLQTFRRGNKILLCGNGGSAADAQHIAAEFIVRFQRERKSFPAIALTTDTSVLTATANDYAYDKVFERQVEGLGLSGDTLIAISTSGNSRNVVQAARKARELGLSVIGLTGKSGGELKGVVDILFAAGISKTSHIQEMHITALHAVSEVVEDLLCTA